MTNDEADMPPSPDMPPEHTALSPEPDPVSAEGVHADNEAVQEDANVADGSVDAEAPPADDDFEDDTRRETKADQLIIDIDGYEGPLDVLLTLAREQKVDLAKISILALVEQYLGFIEHAKKLRLELAADYLVMAAWLAYLKSKLLLPAPEEEEGPTGEELAARLQFQLRRLEAMREAAAQLMARDRLGRDVFPRGAPEPIRVLRKPHYKDTLQDLLKAYVRQRVQSVEITYQPTRPAILAIEDARHLIENMLGKINDWSSLDSFLPELAGEADLTGQNKKTYRASTFCATLEMVRDGYLEVRQFKTFGPVYVRRKTLAELTAAQTGAGSIAAVESEDAPDTDDAEDHPEDGDAPSNLIQFPATRPGSDEPAGGTS